MKLDCTYCSLANIKEWRGTSPVGSCEFHLRQFPHIGSDCKSFALDDDEKKPESRESA